jgi:hypothetical protein
MDNELHYRFFEFAEDNIRAAKLFYRYGCYVQSLYQFCQAFEKIIKSYYILVKTKVERNNTDKVYQDVIIISHEIEDASLNLLIEIGNIEKIKYSQKANIQYASEPRFIQRYERLVREVEGYIKKLDYFRNKELDKNYVKNIQDFAKFTSEKQHLYGNGTRAVNLLCQQKPNTFKEYDRNFLKFLNGIMNLYPCLYKMNETTRYPLGICGYSNLHYLNNEKACYYVMLMVNHLRDAYRWIIQNPIQNPIIE